MALPRILLICEPGKFQQSPELVLFLFGVLTPLYLEWITPSGWLDSKRKAKCISPWLLLLTEYLWHQFLAQTLASSRLDLVLCCFLGLVFLHSSSGSRSAAQVHFQPGAQTAVFRGLSMF